MTAETQDGLLGERYELQERIDRGGLGVVYRALDRQTGREVAVKVLGEHVADDLPASQRLAREARVTASLTSPHVVQVYDFGTDDGRPYLVMEYLPGGTLASHLAGKLPLAADQIVDYGRQIAAGLAAAHARGLIHRDVTLRNVLVAPDGRLKVADFGIAKARGDTALTQTGVALGTAIAMAPEQARGQSVTPATDVYGLGVVLYQLATGQPPFAGDNDVAVALQHVQAPVPPPRQLNPALPAWLEAVILRALAKDASARYPDAAALGAALAAGPDGSAAVSAGAAAAAAGATAVIPEVAGPTVPPLPAEAPPTVPLLRQPLAAATAVLRQVTAAGAAATGAARDARSTPPLPPAARRRRPRPAAAVLAGLAALLLIGLVIMARAQPTSPAPSASATAPARATATYPLPTATVAPALPTPLPPTATPVLPTAKPVAPAPAPVPASDKPDKKKKDEGNKKKGDD